MYVRAGPKYPVSLTQNTDHFLPNTPERFDTLHTVDLVSYSLHWLKFLFKKSKGPITHLLDGFITWPPRRISLFASDTSY